MLVVFADEDSRAAGQRLLRERLPKTEIRSLGPPGERFRPPRAVCRVNGENELEVAIDLCARTSASAVVVATEADIDSGERMAAALRAFGVQIPALLSCVNDLIFVLDTQQRNVAIFGRWPEQSPRRPSELIGKRFRDFFPGDLADLHESACTKALQGEDASYEWRVPDAPWPVHLYSVISPIRNASSDVIGLVLINRDITAFKQAQEKVETALAAKTAHLEELERAVQRLAAVLPTQSGPAREPTGARREYLEMLSPREREVLDLLLQGYRLRSVADRLRLSVQTVRNQVKAMFKKTGAHSQEELIRMFSGSKDSDRHT